MKHDFHCRSRTHWEMPKKKKQKYERRCMSIQEAVKIWKMPTDALVYF